MVNDDLFYALLGAADRAYAKLKIEYDRLAQEYGGPAPPEDECWAEGEALVAVLDEIRGVG